ncbi:restriction endonuclease [Mesorhizobium sp. ZC-5]|uniref:restriction endonuclease n=1 Tax=Mesorhizobium sp. ZC-5 TaxID=2986066 RepID=UPI0021E956BB|nr:restriction endonuclease [Mesorhizobium sp. ZC-5]MCV3243298.1 hypothetical protein [Mesorhizobium sp. ZC-5]
MGKFQNEMVEPQQVRYIKLGSGGIWAKPAIAASEIDFSYREIPHELCVGGAWEAVKEKLAGSKASPGAVTSALREVREFYELGPNCLWITIHGGHLWWAFAESEVVWRGGPEKVRGPRFRRTIGKWSKSDVAGRDLRVEQITSRLTQVAGYRGTICKVDAKDYLIRRINAIVEPVVAKAEAARDVMISAASEMITGLHWKDFEVMTDLIFARSGWQRTTTVGEDADHDILLEQPSTGETAFVQVKSKADGKVFDNYMERFRQSGLDRFFFVCHTPKGIAQMSPSKNVHVWHGATLADITVKNGLFDWLIQRTR